MLYYNWLCYIPFDDIQYSCNIDIDNYKQKQKSPTAQLASPRALRSGVLAQLIEKLSEIRGANYNVIHDCDVFFNISFPDDIDDNYRERPALTNLFTDKVDVHLGL